MPRGVRWCPRVVVSTAAFHNRVRFPFSTVLKETKMIPLHPLVKLSIVGSLRDREVACSASDRQGLNFESCVWRTMSSNSSHHPPAVLLAQFILYVHKSDLNPDSFYFWYPIIVGFTLSVVNDFRRFDSLIDFEQSIFNQLSKAICSSNAASIPEEIH